MNRLMCFIALLLVAGSTLPAYAQQRIKAGPAGTHSVAPSTWHGRVIAV